MAMKSCVFFGKMLPDRLRVVRADEREAGGIYKGGCDGFDVWGEMGRKNA